MFNPDLAHFFLDLTIFYLVKATSELLVTKEAALLSRNHKLCNDTKYDTLHPEITPQMSGFHNIPTFGAPEEVHDK